ncbi:MAG: NAD(P)/FAD-dependent oxidoreductase [Gammaproteobacteria bacterium]
MQKLETDYLIIGSGALGMAFADEILSETDASMIIVDKHHLPGGHWNDAYSFVRLHQPSAFYGVGSRTLGSNRIDESGINKGFFELASGAEVLSYFEQVMRERLLPSGRVRYFPLHEYSGDHRFHALLSGETYQVKVNHRLVDATYFNTTVPSTRPPQYEVDGVSLVTPNQLASSAAGHSRFTIVGGGKTGMDVGVWLLQNGVAPENIRWIVPRDSWLINRETVQPGNRFLPRFMESKALQLEACAAASSIDDLFDRLEDGKQLLRLDRTVEPTMYHNATIAPAELSSLASIGEVIRMGRVEGIEPERILLEGGTVAASPDDLYIDCTASAISRRPSLPVFGDGRITVQMIRAGLFSISAATIAHVEANYGEDQQKNYLCPPMTMPDDRRDWLVLQRAEGEILSRWNEHRELKDWVAGHRLAGANLRQDARLDDSAELGTIRGRIQAASGKAEANLARLLAEEPAQH